MAVNPQDQIIQAIKDLESSQKKQLNRLLACEALLHSFLERTDRQALPGLAEGYDMALIRLAEQLPPQIQLPHLWQGFALAIEDLRKAAGQLPPPPEPGTR